MHYSCDEAHFVCLHFILEIQVEWEWVRWQWVAWRCWEKHCSMSTHSKWGAISIDAMCKNYIVRACCEKFPYSHLPYSNDVLLCLLKCPNPFTWLFCFAFSEFFLNCIEDIFDSLLIGVFFRIDSSPAGHQSIYAFFSSFCSIYHNQNVSNHENIHNLWRIMENIRMSFLPNSNNSQVMSIHFFTLRANMF